MPASVGVEGVLKVVAGLTSQDTGKFINFKGEPVQEAKNKVRDLMISKNLAVAYAEPEGLIISRSSDECVVALMDQWYLDYGEPSWRAQAEKYVFPQAIL